MSVTPNRTVVTLCALILLPVMAASGQELSELAEITVAAEPDYPPYSYLDAAGTPTGFSVELFRAVARVMGLEVTVRTDYWQTIKADLADGRIDALPLVGRTPEREEVFDFTVPYLTLHGGIVVREGDDRFRRLEDLSGRRIAVMAGDNAEEFLRRRETEYDIRPFPTFTDALEDLAGGGSDAVVVQRLVALRLLQQEGFSDLRLLDEPIADFRQDFCFAVTEGNKELLAALNEGLSLVIADGTFRRMQTEWFSPIELPSRTIVVGGDHNYPPFEFLDDDGNPAGYNVDLIYAIAREMRLDVEIRLGSWAHITGMLARGEIDLIQGMMYSTERDRTFDFSPAHTVHHHVAITRADGDREVPSSAEELTGHSIVVQDGDIMHGFVLEHGLTDDLIVVDSQEDALSRVVSGGVDYALGSRLTAMYLIEQNGWDGLAVGRQSLVSTEYGFAVREGNSRLLSYFSEGLSVVEETGEYRSIYDRWLGIYSPVDYSFRRIARIVLIALVPILLVLGTVVAWNRSLRVQVARSTAELEKSVQRKQWLNTIATSYLVRKDAQALIREAVATLGGQIPGVQARFLSLDESGALSEPDAASGEINLESVPVLLDLVRSQKVTAVSDVLEDDLTKPIAEALSAERVRAFAVVIVPVKGAPTGLLAFTAPAPRVWSQHELLTMEEHANLLALILENETYQAEIEEVNRTLVSSLEEKKTLLREVHHRVKNNLNVIVSLLRLQEDQIDSVESARVAFEQSRKRIFSMALVHQSLYQSESLADIALDEYIRTLVEQLKDTAPHDKEIRYACELEPVRIDIANAVPCGIIINELISNAQKHAFADSSGGLIVVSLAHADEASLMLSVRDDGVGLPDAFSAGRTTTLGLKLVTLLAAQIDGEVSFVADGGTRVDLTFPAFVV